METETTDGYYNFQKSKLKQIKQIFSQLTFKDKTIKNRIDELWLGLELKANFADSKKPYFVNGAPVYLKRGQLAICKKTYAEDRKISISVFNRVLSVLEENGLIIQKNIVGVRGHSIITLLNYGESKKISTLSKNSKSNLKDFIGPQLPSHRNNDSMEPTGIKECSNKVIKNLKNFYTPQPKELLNKRTKKTINNKTTTTRGNSSSIDKIINIFREKLPNTIIHINKFKEQLEHSYLTDSEMLKRIEIVSNSPVLTYLCKSINFVFTLENKHSIGFKKEAEYLHYRKIEIDCLKTNDDLQIKLDDIADYLKCSRDKLDEYLRKKGFDLEKPENIEDFEYVEVVEENYTEYNKNLNEINNFPPFDSNKNCDDSPSESVAFFDSLIENNKKNYTRKNIEKTLLNLVKKIPEKRAKVESLLNLIGLAGKINPAIERSFDRIIAT